VMLDLELLKMFNLKFKLLHVYGSLNNNLYDIWLPWEEITKKQFNYIVSELTVQKLEYHNIVEKYNELCGCVIKIRRNFLRMLYCRSYNLNNILGYYIFKKYLFGDDPMKIYSLRDLVSVCNYRKKTVNVQLTEKIRKFVIDEILVLWENQKKIYESYKYIRERCISCRKYYSYHRLLLGNRVKHPLGVNLSSALEEDVLDCLRLIVKKYVEKIGCDNFSMFYFYSHCIQFCKNEESALLEFDYYCIMIYRNRLIIFVIEVDGDQHNTGGFNKKSIRDDIDFQHVRDVLKQYYLSQMNIHLLRVNETESVYYQITKFIQLLIDTDDYVVVNRRVPIINNFSVSADHPGIARFCDYYDMQYRDLCRMSDDNDDDNISDDPSIGFEISPDILNEVLCKEI